MHVARANGDGKTALDLGGWVKGHAFSLARRSGSGYRETFYLWPAGPDSNAFLERLDIRVAGAQPGLGGRLAGLRNVLAGPYMVGTDWVNGVRTACKLYYRVADKALLRRLGGGTDFTTFHTDNILLVLRLDAQGRVSSYKIEPWFDTKDRALYPPAYSALYEDPRIFITRLSYDFNLDGTARKFSVYYGPNYRKY